MLVKDRAKRVAGITTLVCIFILIFLLMFYCNSHTGMLIDDYAYCFDFSTGWDMPNPLGLYPPQYSERITDIGSIFNSMASHRNCHSGRVLSHFLVQLFLLAPKWVFNICNSLVFTLQIFLIMLCSKVLTATKNLWRIVLVTGLAFMCLFLCQPVFGQINIWLDGSFNYLWMSTLMVLYIFFYMKIIKTGVFSNNSAVNILCILLSFAVGMSHEVSGTSMLVLSAVSIIYLHFAKHKNNIWSVLSFASTLTGFLFLLLAPSELSTQMVDVSLSELIMKLFNNLLYLLQLASPLLPLYILSVVLFAIAYFTKADKEVINFTVILFLVTAASFFSLIFASYIVRRCLFVTSVLLTLSCAILASELLRQNKKFILAVVYGATVVMLAITPFSVVKCINDINITYDFSAHNEQYIMECKEAGVEDIKIPALSTAGISEYSPLKNQKYLDTRDSNSWPNIYMAKYYGVNSISFSGELTDPYSN